jgi:hypothetical protein
LAPRATSSARFIISSTPTRRRAAICKPPDVTPELRQKIEDLLALADKKLQPDQFSGFAQTGLRYQSNASLGAGSQTVLASGGTINSAFLARPDWNWFGTVGLNYVHDFQTQTGETFEASVLAYDAQQFSLHQFDIGLLEIRAGPRFCTIARRHQRPDGEALCRRYRRDSGGCALHGLLSATR